MLDATVRCGVWGLTVMVAGALVWAQPEPATPGDVGLFQGVVRPSRQVTLAAPVGGILMELLVEKGDRVEEKQVVARMDDELQKLVTDSARLQAESDTEIEAEKLAAEEARIMHDLAADAFRKGGASEWEVRRAKLQWDQSEAAVKAAHEKKQLAMVNLRLEEEKLSRYRLRAPFTGIVDDIAFEEGATLGTSDKILTLKMYDPLEAELFLPASLYGRLRIGQTYTLIPDQPSIGPLEGRLRFISQDFDSASQTFRCVFTIPNPDWKLPAGFMVRLGETAP